MKAPTCPQCEYRFTLLRSLKHWNPYSTTCPACGAKLRLKRATLFLASSVLGGLALAVAAIVGEETGRWDHSGGRLFIALVGLFLVVPLAIVVWSRSHYVLRATSTPYGDARMRVWLAAVIGGVIGAVIALYLAQVFWMRTLRIAIPTTLRSLEEKQQYTSLVSLAVLNRLEAGDDSWAKHRLAQEVVRYYRYRFDQPETAQRKQVLSLIDATRAKSPTLEKELTSTAP